MGKQVRMNTESESSKTDPRIQKLEWNIQKCDTEATKVMSPSAAKATTSRVSKAQYESRNYDVTEDYGD
jgi:hypothetical protein